VDEADTDCSHPMLLPRAGAEAAKPDVDAKRSGSACRIGGPQSLWHRSMRARA
jgi:hypothetical protein